MSMVGSGNNASVRTNTTPAINPMGSHLVFISLFLEHGRAARRVRREMDLMNLPTKIDDRPSFSQASSPPIRRARDSP